MDFHLCLFSAMKPFSFACYRLPGILVDEGGSDIMTENKCNLYSNDLLTCFVISRKIKAVCWAHCQCKE